MIAAFALLLGAAPPQVLESVPAGAQPLLVTLSRECGEGCPLLVKWGASQLQIPDLSLPPGEAKRQGAQWSLGEVFFSVRPLPLGKTAGLLIEVLRVPRGEDRAMGSWRVIAAAPLRQLLAFGDTDPALGIGRVAFADDVLHLTHDQPGDTGQPDRFAHQAWDWTGARLRQLAGATLYAVAVGAGPSLEQMRRIQQDVQAGCREVLRTYESARFEGIPQQYFAGRVFLRRQEAEAALAQVKPCAPTAEIFETAWVPQG